MQQIYLVKADWGNYGDHSSWVVVAFLELEKAQEYAMLANKAEKEMQKIGDARVEAGESSWEVRHELVNPYDPDSNYSPYDDPTEYSVEVIVILNEVPQKETQ